MNYNKDKFLGILNKLKELFGSQNKMAEALGISSSYITKIYDENTKNPPAPEYLKKIADNSKGVTTYEELMEICGYKEESLESYTYNSYNKLKKFETFLQEKENNEDVVNVDSVVQDFLKYVDILKNNIYEEGEDEYNTIFLYDIFREKFLKEDYGYVTGFMILYDDFIKYLEKTNVVQVLNYTFLNWFKIENIYSILKNFNKIELLSYNCEIVKLINDNIDILEIEDKIRNYANCISLALLSDSDNNNILSDFFKYKANEYNYSENNVNNESTTMVAGDSEPYYTDNNTIKIPVVGTVAAGEPILAEQNIVDYEELPAEEFKDGDYFGLKIKGDSMFPRILEGDVVIVRQQSDCDNGKVAVVLINGDEATVKQIKKTESGIMLIPFNNKYDPMFFTKEEIETKPVKIIGVVKRLIGYNFG